LTRSANVRLINTAWENKNISYRKQIVRQNSCHKNFGQGRGVVDPEKFSSLV